MKKLNFIQSAEQVKDPDVIDIHEEDIDMEFFKAADDLIIEMSVRSEGEFTDKAVYLPGTRNYAIGLDSIGGKILIPLKKK